MVYYGMSYMEYLETLQQYGILIIVTVWVLQTDIRLVHKGNIFPLGYKNLPQQEKALCDIKKLHRLGGIHLVISMLYWVMTLMLMLLDGWFLKQYVSILVIVLLVSFLVIEALFRSKWIIRKTCKK